MDHLLQLYQCNYNNLSIPNAMYVPIKPIQDSPISNEDDSYLQEIICDGKKYRSCTFPGCGKIFRYKSEILRHKSIHTTQRDICCPFMSCTKTFKREDALKNHIRTHTGETPYKCKEPGCGQSFSSRGGLKYHSLKHNGKKEFCCSVPGCNKTFLTLQQLNQHEGTLNYHQKISTQVQWREPRVEIKKYKDLYYKESNTPEMDKVQNSVFQDEKAKEDAEEEFERMVKILVKENNAMKTKIHTTYTYSGLIPERKDSQSKCSSISEVGEQCQFPIQEPSKDKPFTCLSFYDQ